MNLIRWINRNRPELGVSSKNIIRIGLNGGVVRRHRSVIATATNTELSVIPRRPRNLCGGAVISRNTLLLRTQCVRSFQFATEDYADCFLGIAQPTADTIRHVTVDYVSAFDPQRWYKDPVVSLLNADILAKAETQAEIDTTNALGEVNGKQILASNDQIDKIIHHVLTYNAPEIDLRVPVRHVEDRLWSKHSGYLVGNQCIDYKKPIDDCVAEMRMSMMTGLVERKLNDLLLQEENTGSIAVPRKPKFVLPDASGTNFFDLSRNILRFIESGIPVVILCDRSNEQAGTVQHVFRLVQVLLDLCCVAGIDAGMITYVSAASNDVERILDACRISSDNGEETTIAQCTTSKTCLSASSRGTMVCLDWDSSKTNHDSLQKAIAQSVENSGDWTSMKHCIVPLATPDEDCISIVDNLNSEKDDGDLDGKHNKIASKFDIHFQYDQLPSKVPEVFPRRKVSVNFSKVDLQVLNLINGRRDIDPNALSSLSNYICTGKPLSLAINGTRKDILPFAIQLWERTNCAMVSIGSTDTATMVPALTTLNSPQFAEINSIPMSLSEVRSDFPLLIPSSSPSYGATYQEDYLKIRGTSIDKYMIKSTLQLLQAVNSDAVRGYCLLIIDYLQNVSVRNPKQSNSPEFTTMWGLQRPPMNAKTIISCGGSTTWDEIAPIYILFHSTNAREQIELEIDQSNTNLIDLCNKSKLKFTSVSKEHHPKRDPSDVVPVNSNEICRYIDADDKQCFLKFPIADKFVSLFFSCGHIKSSASADEEFMLRVKTSRKWLNTLF